MSASVAVEATVAGTRIVVQRRNIEEAEDEVDPNFFDADYSIAASTGSLMWEGSWAVIEQLRRQDAWLTERLRGAKCVELGSGIGLLGCAAAAVGAHVLLTDVPAIVDTVLLPNIRANAAMSPEREAVSGGWRGATRVGSGSACAQPLDWERPLDGQRPWWSPDDGDDGDGALPNDPRDCSVVLAAECVWLKELVPPFVRTVTAILSCAHRPVCILAFRERANLDTSAFSSAASVLAAFDAAGCEARERGEVDAPEAVGLFTRLYELAWRGAPACERAASGSGEVGE